DPQVADAPGRAHHAAAAAVGRILLRIDAHRTADQQRRQARSSHSGADARVARAVGGAHVAAGAAGERVLEHRAHAVAVGLAGRAGSAAGAGAEAGRADITHRARKPALA